RDVEMSRVFGDVYMREVHMTGLCPAALSCPAELSCPAALPCPAELSCHMTLTVLWLSVI
ncbi:MAG: hypothetical protein K2J60_12505, partial [Acetatifactor sp.]|nr:hypothetical protein [Acetatifactor sp.]